jgi:hypothetical protein
MRPWPWWKRLLDDLWGFVRFLLLESEPYEEPLHEKPLHEKLRRRPMRRSRRPPA